MKTKLASLCLKIFAFARNENQDIAQGWRLEEKQLKPVHSLTEYSYTFLFLKVKVKQSHYRPGQAQMVPGS